MWFPMSRSRQLALRQPGVIPAGLVALVCLHLGGSVDAAPEPGLRWGYLSNGSGYLVIANRSAPMIGCSAVVQGGSGAESSQTQGASHMLEHLLFNGTETLTQEELYAGFDRLGTYANATTRPTHVNYMILGPSDRFWDAFALQTEMIFRSTLPPEKLEKERGIVLEELAKDRLDSGYRVERTFEMDLFGPRGYGLPTLGTETSIRNLTRDQVLEFYRSFYGPERLTWILIGDFDPDAAVDSLEARVGVFPAHGGRGAAAVPGPDPTGALRREHVAEVDSPSIRITWEVDASNSQHFIRFEAAFQNLCEGESSPLGTEARRLGATSYAAGLRLFPEFTLLQVDCELGADGDPDAFVEAFLRAAAGLDARPVDAAALARWKIGRETEEVFLREKPHYYAVFRGDRIVARGLPAIAAELKEIQAVEVGTLTGVLPLDQAPLRITILHPRAGRSDVAMAAAPSAPMMHGGHGHLQITTPTPSPANPLADAEVPPAELARWTLPNGLSVLARSAGESPVFAAHLFIRGRARREPTPGAAELLHTLLGNRAAEGELQASLSAIGAELKTADDPSIPYDDFYSVPEFSYIRLQTLDRFAPRALELLAEILTRPNWKEADFEAARALAIQRAAQEDSAPRTRARRALADSYRLEGSNAYVFGTEEGLRDLGFPAFQEFAREYLDARGMFLVLASGLPSAAIEELTHAALGQLPSGGEPLAQQLSLPPWSPEYVGLLEAEVEETMEPGGVESVPVDLAVWTEQFGDLAPPTRAHLEVLGGSQSYLLVSALLEVPASDEAALELAASLLSDRLAFQLREREGLAYSIGASVAPLRSGRWLYQAAAGTRPENLGPMLVGLRDGVKTALAEPIDAEILATQIAGIEGRTLMRRVTRMNWAFHAGAAALRGEDPEQELAIYDRMRSVAPSEVERILRTAWPGTADGVFLVR